MVLGLYYITKGRRTDESRVVKGQDQSFYSPQEVIIAYNEKMIDLHAFIKVKVNVKQEDGTIVNKLTETTVGRVLFNQMVPEEVGYINELLTKKSLRDIIGNFVKEVGIAKTSKFLDDMKDLGFHYAFKGGLSFNLNYGQIPAAKKK